MPKKIRSVNSSSFTTVGTPTIITNREMPCFDDIDSSETETGSYETESTESVTGSSSYASEDQFEFSVTNEPSEREKAGKCSATSDETSSVDVSLSEYTTENCCIHGKPCIIGQGESEVTSTSSRKVPEYEPVKLDVLQNPPESYSRRSRREEPPKKGMVYMLQRPPDMTSSGFYTSRSPSKTSKSNHLYENMDTLNNSLSAITESDKPSDLVSTKSSASSKNNQTAQLRNFYIGALCKHEAEKFVKRPTSFRVYHRLPSKANYDLSYLPDTVKLYIAYKTSHGDFVHYPICRTSGDGSRYYYVDTEETENPTFSTLDALVRYYSVYVLMNLVQIVEEIELFAPRRRRTTRKSRR